MKRLFLVISLILLSGCQKEPLTYNYLIQHPEFLQNKIEECHLQDVAGCDIVKRAAEDFLELTKQEEQDPEAFGKQILKLQQDYGTTSQKKTPEELESLKAQINARLAIVATTSPE